MSSLFEDVDFTDFYKAYPRKVGKADAQKAWDKVPGVDKPVLMSRLPGWLQQYGQDPKFIPYPASWLRARRWEDEIRDVPQLPQRGSSSTEQRELGMPNMPSNLSGLPDFGDPPTEEERQEGIKILRQCVEKLTANDLRLRLKTIAVRRTGKCSPS